MPVQSALIHEFDPKAPPKFDEDGDQMIGFYYQFLDHNDEPLYGLIGPYSYKHQAESAAKLAFDRHDF